MFVKHLNYTIAFLAFICTSSCVTPRATFQSKTYQPQKKGVITYSLTVSLFQPDAVYQRRMDAKMKMEDFCGSQEPTIISETKKEETTGYHTSTSYQDRSNEYSRKQHSRRYHKAHKNLFSSASGSASTVSQPIIKTYNIINFECR